MKPLHLSYTPSVFADAYKPSDRRSAFRIGSRQQDGERLVEALAWLVVVCLLLAAGWLAGWL